MNSIRKAKNYILTRIYCGILYCAFRIKVVYEDPEMKKNPPQGIYICNHMAHLDGFIVRCILRKIKPYTLITNTWYDRKWARALLFFENFISVDRDNPGTGWIHESRKALKSGYSVNIFPEGYTSKSEEVKEFKPGFLLLASMVRDVPIIPIATTGMYNWFHGERKRVMIGKPIPFDKSKFGLDDATSQAYAEEFRQIVLDMKRRLKEDRK